MAETITIAGKKMPKNMVYVLGAGVAGFVGYAWYTKGLNETPPAAIPEIPEPVKEPTDTPGFSASSGSAPPMTNADWGELAVERLINIGLDGPAVSSALGKFLARRPLSKIDVDLVQQAIRAAGLPPQNGPWVVIDEPIPPPVAAQPAPGGVTGLRFSSKTRTQLTASWGPPSGDVSVSKYGYQFFGGASGGGTFVVSSGETSSLSAKSSNNLRPDHPYGVRVRAIGSNGKLGPFVTAQAVRTLK